MRAMLIAVVIFGTASARDGSARAESSTVAAKAHYEKGTTLYDLGKYLEAAREYEEAYSAKNDPALLFNIAQAYRLGGDSPAALRTYRSYLRRVPDASNRQDVERHIANLQRVLDEQKRASTAPPTDTMQPAQMQAPSLPTASVPTPAIPSATALPTASPPPPKRVPLYKKWWLWTAVAAVAVVGAGVGIAVAETTPNNAPAPSGTMPVSFP
jgi:tetratricopeptide (TPR) repeat protein